LSKHRVPPKRHEPCKPPLHGTCSRGINTPYSSMKASVHSLNLSFLNKMFLQIHKESPKKSDRSTTFRPQRQKTKYAMTKGRPCPSTLRTRPPLPEFAGGRTSPMPASPPTTLTDLAPAGLAHDRPCRPSSCRPCPCRHGPARPRPCWPRPRPPLPASPCRTAPLPTPPCRTLPATALPAFLSIRAEYPNPNGQT
jgi:hypothetical protein